MDTKSYYVNSPINNLNYVAGTNIYVDKDGNDSTGNGTSSNPYKSIAKATSVGTSGDNIILGNGVWEEQRTLNSKYFNFYGCGMTWIKGNVTPMTVYSGDHFYYIKATNINATTYNSLTYFHNCIVMNLDMYGGIIESCICINVIFRPRNFTFGEPYPYTLLSSIFYNCTGEVLLTSTKFMRNNIFLKTAIGIAASSTYPFIVTGKQIGRAHV